MNYNYNWIKSGNQWKHSNNHIKVKDLLEYVKPYDKLNIVKSDSNKSVVYVPVHNINDIFEWYRIFRTSHITNSSNFTENLDKYGFWIHGFFDKEESQSIKTYFPNLIKVKAASSEDYIYDVNVNQAVKYSKDYIEPSLFLIANAPNILINLTIDGVNIFENELVLLKNQVKYSYFLKGVISSTFNTVNISTFPNYLNEIKVGSTLRYTSNNIPGFFDNEIISIIENLGIITITIKDTFLHSPTLCYDLYNAKYIETGNNFNGIYKCVNNRLILIDEMFNEDTLFNQIVYCYDGKTQQNKEYYLRRLDNYSNPNYSKFPVKIISSGANGQNTSSNPFVYSEGNAHLVKFELDYNLDINVPLHPITSGPFIQDNTEDVYRLLFLDQDIPSKIMSTDKNGIGTYDKIELNLGSGHYYNEGSLSIFGVPFNFISFSLFSPITNDINVIGTKIEKGIYENYPLLVPNGTHYVGASAETSILAPLEQYTLASLVVFQKHTYQYNGFNIPLYFPVLSNTLLDYTTNIQIDHNGFYNVWDFWLYNLYYVNNMINNGSPLTEDQLLTNGALVNDGFFINIKIEYNKGDGFYTALDDVFLVTRIKFFNDLALGYATSQNAEIFDFNIYPRLSDDIINEYNSIVLQPVPSSYQCKITFDLIQNNVDYNQELTYDNSLSVKLLESALNKFKLNEIYEYELTQSINYLVYDDINFDIHNLLITPSISLLMPVSFNIGDILLINSQINPLENGIYIYQGINMNLIRSSILFTSDTVFQSKNTNDLVFSERKLYKASFFPIPNNEYPIYGTTNITFVQIFNYNLNSKLIINDIRQQYEIKDVLYSTKIGYGNAFNKYVTSIDFINKWEKQNNINNNLVQLDAIYSREYSVTKYLHDYLGIYNNINNLHLVNFTNITGVYYNIENDINRIGFERNKIILGKNFKSNVLKLNKNILFNLTYNITNIPNIMILDFKYDDINKIGVLITNYNFDELVVLPSTFDNVILDFINVNSLSNIQTNLFDNTTHIFRYRPDTSGYAYSLMNYNKHSSQLLNTSGINETITGIIFKENSKTRISLSKRDKHFEFNNQYTIINTPLLNNVDYASTTNIDILNPPAIIDGLSPNIGDLILLKDNIMSSENGVYIYNGAMIPLTFDSIYIQPLITYGIVNAGKNFQHIISTNTYVETVHSKTILKNDNRLHFRPIEIAKLCVDNETQSWQKISNKYDISEIEENKVNIQIGINGRRRIRFIDGLSENKIINNIDNQGIYSWILNDDVIVEDAVVGQVISGSTLNTIYNIPVGTLIWYTGTWFTGIWENGVWISGNWIDGIWNNGSFNSFVIQDLYTNVTFTNNQTLINSTWNNGTWNNGNFNGGTWIQGTWNNGIHNGGLWKTGTWNNGTWNNGTFESGTWNNGSFNNGYFETGTWNNGTFNRLDNTSESIFGYKSTLTNRSIWKKGTFIDGEIWSGQNINNNIISPNIDDYRTTILFSSNIKNCYFRGGTLVFTHWENGIFENGISLGGYNVTFNSNNTLFSKNILIDPNQYFNMLGIINNEHNLHYCNLNGFIFFGELTSANIITQGSNFNYWKNVFYNTFENNNVIGNTYQVSTIDNTYIQDATHINLIFNIPGDCTTPSPLFVIDNQILGELDGKPFMSSIFLNVDWRNGIWCNGYNINGTFNTGVFLKGYIETSSSFGVNQE